MLICNLCGLSCEVSSGEDYGLENCKVSGGYHSTAGNGDGALDDGETYTFSLCEFCLDWLFCQFKEPVKVVNYMVSDPSISEGEEEWRPAAQRVKEDDWRKGKEGFFREVERRNKARGK